MCFVIQLASAGTAGSDEPEAWSPCAQAATTRSAVGMRTRILVGVQSSAFVQRGREVTGGEETDRGVGFGDSETGKNRGDGASYKVKADEGGGFAKGAVAGGRLHCSAGWPVQRGCAAWVCPVPRGYSTPALDGGTCRHCMFISDFNLTCQSQFCPPHRAYFPSTRSTSPFPDPVKSRARG